MNLSGAKILSQIASEKDSVPKVDNQKSPEKPNESESKFEQYMTKTRSYLDQLVGYQKESKIAQQGKAESKVMCFKKLQDNLLRDVQVAEESLLKAQ